MPQDIETVFCKFQRPTYKLGWLSKVFKSRKYGKCFICFLYDENKWMEMTLKYYCKQTPYHETGGFLNG